MKKIYYLIAMAMMAFTFTSCEDVPEPFGQPINPNSGSSTTVDPAGSGTATDPYNVAAVLDYVKGLGSDAESPNDVYISGIVTEVTEAFGTQYGNATFKIADVENGKTVFTFYRGLYLGNVKYSDASAPNVNIGDKVVICGRVIYYKGTTPETSQGKAYVVSINGTGGGDTPTPSGDAKAVSVADFLAAAESTTDWYQLKGTVKNLKDGDQYGNFDIEDATGSVYVYGLVAEKGGEKKKFQELVAAKGIANGKTITIIGNRGAYNGTAQVANAYFVSIEGNTPPTPSGDNLLTNGDFETWSGSTPTNWKTSSSAGNATLAQSSDAHGGSYSVSVGFAADANKRLGYKETTLKAGTYTFSFYAKATTAEKSQTQAGFVNIKDDGKTDKYTYGGYVSLTNTEWTLVSTTFTLAADTKVSLVMMCPKNSDYAVAQNILVDDASLVTSDGGIADDGGEGGGGDTPSGDAQTVTIAQFNAAAVSTSVWYQLTGTIKNMKEDGSDQYGNFDIEDETGSVYVYGLLSEKGGAKKKFQELVAAKGIANGKKITIIGNRGDYQGKIEVVNAYFVSIE